MITLEYEYGCFEENAHWGSTWDFESKRLGPEGWNVYHVSPDPYKKYYVKKLTVKLFGFKII